MGKFKRIVCLGLMLIVAISFAWAGASQEAEESSSKKDITLWTFLDLASTNTRAKVLGKLIDDFHAKNKDVTVTVETQAWTTLSAKIWASHAAGNAPDMFMVNTENLGGTISTGCMEPLENLFYNEWSEQNKNDVKSAMWDAGYDGTYHYQVPVFSGVFGILYRSDIFNQFGITVEEIETWSDLVDAAKTMTYTNTDGMKVYGLGIGYSTEVVDPHGHLPAALFSQKGGMFSEDGYPNNWSGLVGQNALQYQIDLIDKHKVMPSSVVALTSEEIYNQFEAGQYAMMFGGSIRIPTVKGLSSFDPDYVQFMPFPAMEKGGTSSISNVAGWHIGVWSDSKNKEIAGAFIEHLVSPEADALWVTEATQLPIRKSTLEMYKDVFDKPENAWMADAASVVNKSATVLPTDFVVSKYTYDLQFAMIRAYVDGLSPEEALLEAEKNFIERNIDR